MRNNGVIVLAALAALGLAVALFGVTWLSSPGAGTRTIAAAVLDEGLGDAINCQTGQPAMDAPLDIESVTVTEKQGGYDVHVRTALPASEVFTNAYSAAVLVTLGNQDGIAQIHAETETIGLEDDFANIIPGTEGNVRIESDGVHFNFPGELKEGAELIVETFHQKSFLDDVTCDTAFSDDPTAPKPGDPTATPTPTPMADSPTATPTPIDDLDLVKVTVQKFNADIDEFLVGWGIEIFGGDGCTGPLIASGATGNVPGDSDEELPGFVYWVELPPGDYSAAEDQAPGWEIVPEASSCRDFTVFFESSPDQVQEGPLIQFTNRKIRHGDVTGDGVANSVDASVLLQYTAGLVVEDFIADFFRGDVNLDDTTDSRDAQLVLQSDAGLYNFPCVPDCGYFECAPDCDDFSCEPDCGDFSCDPDCGDFSCDPDCGDFSCDPDCGDFSCDPDCGDTSSRGSPASESFTANSVGARVQPIARG